MRCGTIGGIAVTGICSKTAINRSYARKIPTFWIWCAAYILIRYEPGLRQSCHHWINILLAVIAY
jgi:hypothetical protein